MTLPFRLNAPARRSLCLSGALFLGLLLVLPATPAAAQSGDLREVLNRLQRLETEMQTVSREVFRGGGAPRTGAGAPSGGTALPGNVAGDFEIRLQRLEEDVRTMTGRYEEATFQIGQLREQMERLTTDLEYRLGQLEKGGAQAAPADGALPVGGAAATTGAGGATAPAASTTPAAPAASAGAQQLPAGDAQAQYDFAYGLLRQRDYAGAHDALAQFLATHKDHSLAANAQYWMGETLYVRNMFKEAAIAFGDAYQKYPKSSKAPDSLLKLSMSLGAMGQKDSACVALRQLGTQFKDAPTTIQRRAEQEKTRLRCG